MKYLKIYLNLSRFKQIVITVILVHFLLFTFSFLSFVISRQIKPKEPIHVRTIQLVSPKRPTPTKKIKRKAPPKKPIAKAPKKAKKTAPKQQTLLKEIQKNFSAIESESKQPKRTHLSIPSIHTTPIDSNAPPQPNPNFDQFLISYLQSMLTLPEYGKVKVEITIDHLGRLKKCEILEFQSHKNAQFLKEELAELPFPELSQFRIDQSFYTFTITFKNSEIENF